MRLNTAHKYWTIITFSCIYWKVKSYSISALIWKARLGFLIQIPKFQKPTLREQLVSTHCAPALRITEMHSANQVCLFDCQGILKAFWGQTKLRWTQIILKQSCICWVNKFPMIYNLEHASNIHFLPTSFKRFSSYQGKNILLLGKQIKKKKVVYKYLWIKNCYSRDNLLF